MRRNVSAVLAGAAASSAIAALAWRRGTLDRGGALAAACVGTATVAGLGAPGAAVLLGFFAPSVALTRLGASRKTVLDADVGKGGPRDARQVLANGGVAAICALAARTSRRARYAFAGAFAAAAADTWATEIGTLAARPPRSILTLRPISPGFSGGITLPGTVAEVAGAAFVASLGRLTLGVDATAVVVAGTVGATVDSVLGASLQALRHCPVCDRRTERRVHECGTRAPLVRGLAGVDNDVVNALATLAGASVAALLAPRTER